jgi:hypothetical protein
MPSVAASSVVLTPKQLGSVMTGESLKHREHATLALSHGPRLSKRCTLPFVFFSVLLSSLAGVVLAPLVSLYEHGQRPIERGSGGITTHYSMVEVESLIAAANAV